MYAALNRLKSFCCFFFELLEMKFEKSVFLFSFHPAHHTLSAGMVEEVHVSSTTMLMCSFGAVA